MYLSKLDIFGFKSFATKTTVPIEQGINSIVGPNGCGKTNIVDAIRWVLGEQRTSMLRTERMQDVIFNGSKGRKPLGYAEVSLTLHNNRGILPTEFTDVMVTRRLFRDGESEYLLNKNLVRLKDINDLFVDTGMGPDAYSVIELKMVDSLLSDDPVERRKLFEEAAGITKYKNQRRATIRKLEATKTDLLRVYDIISEVEKNVRSLKYQLGKFKRYQKEKNLLVESEIRLARFQYHDILQKMVPVSKMLQTQKLRRDDAASQIVMDEALHQQIEKKLEALDVEIEACEIKVEKHAQLLIDSKEKQGFAKQRIVSEQTAIDNAERRIESAKIRLKALDEQEALFADQLEQSEASLQKQTEQHGRIQLKLEYAIEQLKSKQNYQRELEHEQALYIEKLGKLNSEKQKYIARAEAIENSGEARLKEKGELEETLKSFTKALHDANRRRKRIITDRTLIDEKISAATEELDGLKSKVARLEEKKSSLTSQQNNLKSRVTILSELIEGRGGHSSGVKNLLENGNELSGIYGTVADLIEVKPDYRKAIDQSLGSESDWVVVDTLRNAKSAARWVAERKKGSVTFLALDSLRNTKSNGRAVDGFLPATDFVNSQHNGLVTSLFSDLLITKNGVDQKVPEGYRVVDSNGYMYDGAAMIKSGGYESDDTGKIGRKELRNELSRKIEAVEKSLLENEKEYISAKNSLENTRKLIDELTAQVREILTEDASLAGKINGLEAEIVRVNNRLTQMESEGSDKENLEKLRKAGDEIQTKIDSFEEHQAGFLSKYEEMIMEVEMASKEKDDISAQHQEAMIAVVADERNQDALKFRLSGIEETWADAKIRRDSSDEEIKICKQNIIDLKLENEESDLKILELEKERKELFAERDELNRKKDRLRAEKSEIDKELREKRKEKDVVAESTQEMELRLTEFKMDSERIFNHISGAYGIQITEPPEDETFNESEESEKLLRLRTKIENMGPVNMAVENEYQSETERLEFLLKQRDDLTAAEKTLLSTMKQIDETARKQFLECFGKIRDNFKRTFIMYFEGGNADINLRENEDPLEARIEISARPPGKRNHVLKQLSGGEKALTAIALLFAIYLVKPSPFCILDEIDAPLDDANIKRFSKVLDKFAKDTQFIVVTHNKDTMKSAGSLFGVTMEEVGVSKIVSVNLN